MGIGAIQIERILYGQDYSNKKIEGNVCKIMYNAMYENQAELHSLIIGALE